MQLEHYAHSVDTFLPTPHWTYPTALGKANAEVLSV